MNPEFDLENVQHATPEKGKSPVFRSNLMIEPDFRNVVIKLSEDNLLSIDY